jgi:ribosomal-protein-serine acetyltransferase
MERVFTRSAADLILPAGDGIELRAISTADCAELYAAIDRNHSRLRKWLPWVTATFQESDLLEFIRQREIDNANQISWTTTIRLNGQICGSISLHTINPRDRNSSIGYWLDGDHQGRGIMTRACRAMVSHGFRQYGLHRIEIRCATGNIRSMAVPQRLGFAEEGILRDAEWLHDHWVDLRVFSMLDQDWNLES